MFLVLVLGFPCAQVETHENKRDFDVNWQPKTPAFPYLAGIINLHRSRVFTL